MRRAIGIPEDALVIGFVGRIVFEKGVTELLAAWTRLRSVHTFMHLILVGPFEKQDPIPAEARTQIAEDPSIHWLGENRDMPPIYATMDLLVLPSYREGLGMALLEAAAMGLPVIATDIPGCVDAVQDGITGTLVPPHDAYSLADAISRYVVNPALRQRHGNSGRTRVLRSFDQEAIWAATYAEYRRLLARRGIAPSIQIAPPHAQAA
jgi:glycosyltransferase involved in cell wall biosynthesis